MPLSPDPAAAPAALSTATLPDGTVLTLRPIQATDAPALQRFHSRLSERSIYRRFFEWVPQLTDQRAEYFTQLDGVNRHAIIALDPQQPAEIIGVVRYDREPGTARAEYAIIVEDHWQHRGVGRCLTDRLIADARAAGLRVLYALVLPENRAMLALFHRLELPLTTHMDGAVLQIDLQLA